MAKISTYAIDATPTLQDKVIGTDVNDSNITKNYTLGDIIALVPPIPSIVTDLHIPISNGVDYVDSVITQDSTTAPTTISIGGLIGITGTGESVFVGKNAGVLSDKTVPQFNIGVGDGALESFTSGLNPVTGAAEPGANIALGVGALAKSVQSTNNVGIGIDSLKENTVGFNNVAISKNALGSSVDATTQGMTNNQGSIGIGFSAGNPNSGSELPSGHVNDTIVGHQAMADIFYSAGAAPVQNTVLGMRALRNVGVSGYGATLNGNVVIGASAGLGIKAGPDSVNPGQGSQNNLTLKENVFIGKNAGNNLRGLTIEDNIILGATSNSTKYVYRGNVIFNTGGSDNNLGNFTAPGPIQNNFLVGSRTAVYTDKNIVINPNRYQNNVSPNTLGTPNIANPNATSAVTNNIILGDKFSSGASVASNNKLQFEDPQGLAVSVGSITGSFIVNSANTTMFANNNAELEGNVVIHGDSNAITGTASQGANNNYILGSTFVSLVDSDDNFVFATTPSAVYQLSNVDKNFLWGIGSNNLTATITDGSDENFLFNTPSIDLTGNGNTVFGAAGTIAGDDNVFLNGGGLSVTGNKNVVFGQNVAVGNSTQRALAFGFGHELGTAGTVNNSFVAGNNNKITAGANNNLLGSNLVSDATSNSVVVGQNNDETVNTTQGKTSFQVGVGSGAANRKNAFNVVREGGPLFGVIYMDQLVNQNYANDVDAKAAGIGLGGLYHTNGVVKINITP
tara:strand:- start:22107 stop:24317 length:2211 start_codon:yes stop_codon:yes gene_type:complete